VFTGFFATAAATVRDAIGADWTAETASTRAALLVAMAPLPDQPASIASR